LDVVLTTPSFFPADRFRHINPEIGFEKRISYHSPPNRLTSAEIWRVACRHPTFCDFVRSTVDVFCGDLEEVVESVVGL